MGKGRGGWGGEGESGWWGCWVATFEIEKKRAFGKLCQIVFLTANANVQNRSIMWITIGSDLKIIWHCMQLYSVYRYLLHRICFGHKWPKSLCKATIFSCCSKPRVKNNLIISTHILFLKYAQLFMKNDAETLSLALTGTKGADLICKKNSVTRCSTPIFA